MRWYNEGYSFGDETQKETSRIFRKVMEVTMHYTVEMLVKGDPQLAEYYRRAVERWKQVWARPEAKDRFELATLLTDEQTWFEENCGSRALGQEIMVVAGFGMLYSISAGFNGNTERAQLLYDAFQMSLCSIEVKYISRKLAESYRLVGEKVF
jgi:hypothetical protein